jgi:glycosyltransferase involved in cell wall biosynthesis
MKIVNISHVSFPDEHDPELWIQKSMFFKGIWEAVANMDEVIFIDFIGYEGKLKRNDIEYWFYRRTKKALRLPVSIHRIIAKQNPDVIIVHGVRSPLQVLLLRLIAGRKPKIVVQDHGGGYFQSSLKKYLQHLADRVIDIYFFTSLSQADILLQQGIIKDKKKIREVIEVSSVFKSLDREACRKITGVAGDKSYIWVGRLNANKDPMLVIKAFTQFVADRNDAVLYMIFQTEELLPEIQSWLKENSHAAKHINLVGKVPHDQLQYWYNSVDFIISTSHYEAGGVSVCEGMSCGCIPILSDIPSFRTMTNNQCGIIFEQGSQSSLLQAIHASALMNKEVERGKALAQFDKHLSFTAIAQHIHEVLSTLTENGIAAKSTDQSVEK